MASSAAASSGWYVYGVVPASQLPADAFAGTSGVAPSGEIVLIADDDLAAITSDVIDCHVASPPQTPDDARAVAREQYKYCGDIVSQGTESVERLAIELWRSPSWYFWWD